MATLEQLEAALRAADAAGNVEDARRLAQAYAQARSQQQPRADFSNVQGRSDTVAATKPPTLLQRGARELGLGTRASLQGVFGTLGIVTDPLAHVAGLPSAREGATALADRLGLPSPQSPTERIGGAITEAVSGGGGVIGTGKALAARTPGYLQAAGEFLASHPASQLASLVGGSGASSTTREAGGSEGAQGLAGLIGGLGLPYGAAGAQASLRGLLRGGERGRQAVQQAIRDFRSVGAQPSVGQATGNRRTQGLESLLAGAPTSTGRMTTFAERQAEQIGQGLQRRADNFFPNASGERAGRAIERGVDTFAGNVKATKRALYWLADKRIPDATRVPMANTWQKVVELTTPNPGAKETTKAMVNGTIARLRDTLEQDLSAGGGQITYDALKRIRTDIGEAITDYSLSPDTPTREYKALYAALSRDMEAAARAQGPEAVAAAHRANDYTRAAADRLEQIQRVVDKNGGPEKVFAAAMSGTQDGGTTLRAVMQSLPADGQKAVTAAVIKRMGLATPGQQGAVGEAFSAQTFLTNWNRVSPEARRALFDRYGPQFARDMDKISRVAERIRNGSRVFANPSGTANRATAIGYYGSLAGATGAAAVGAGATPLAFLVMGGLSANAAARLMTNPKLVSWLARATEMPASALPQQVVLLKQAMRDDPDAQEVLAELERQNPANQ